MGGSINSINCVCKYIQQMLSEMRCGSDRLAQRFGGLRLETSFFFRGNLEAALWLRRTRAAGRLLFIVVVIHIYLS